MVANSGVGCGRWMVEMRGRWCWSNWMRLTGEDSKTYFNDKLCTNIFNCKSCT